MAEPVEFNTKIIIRVTTSNFINALISYYEYFGQIDDICVQISRPNRIF